MGNILIGFSPFLVGAAALLLMRIQHFDLLYQVIAVILEILVLGLCLWGVRNIQIKYESANSSSMNFNPKKIEKALKFVIWYLIFVLFVSLLIVFHR